MASCVPCKANGSNSVSFEVLKKVIAYENKPLVDKLRSKLQLSDKEAFQLFDDTKRFLYLCAIGEAGSPTRSIDEGWHNFILYTKDYAAFCQDCFGEFIHHQPDVTELSDKQKISRAQKTLAAAEKFFGKETLSVNWELSLSKPMDSSKGGDCRSECEVGVDCN